MQTHQAKRVEIIIEAPMQKRMAAALEAAEVTGYTMLPVLGGSGRSGRWSREGQVSAVGGMIGFVCIVAPERIERLKAEVFALLDRHIGVVSITDCEVLRAERF